MRDFKMKRKGQSEMVGFGLIIIIVAVLILIFLSIYLRGSNEDVTESFEVEAFVQSILQYTTDCEMDYSGNYRDVRRLLFDCKANKPCFDDRNSCIVLNETIYQILEGSWEVGPDSVNKGYLFNATVEGEEMVGFKKGNETNLNKGTSQTFTEGLDIKFILYN